jgi:hypothetical protein
MSNFVRVHADWGAAHANTADRPTTRAFQTGLTTAVHTSPAIALEESNDNMRVGMKKGALGTKGGTLGRMGVRKGGTLEGWDSRRDGTVGRTGR